jgi:hypothetical protein
MESLEAMDVLRANVVVMYMKKGCCSLHRAPRSFNEPTVSELGVYAHDRWFLAGLEPLIASRHLAYIYR